MISDTKALELKHVSVSATPLFDDNGNYTVTLALISDITDRKRAEEVMQESEERYRGLVESVRDIIYTVSLDGTITSLNPAFETITEWSRDKWLGKPLQSIVHPNDWPLASEMFQRMLDGENPPTHEVRLRSKSGEYIIGEFIITPHIKDGEVVGILGVGRDITERKRLTEQLIQSEKFASLGQLASGIAHEFRNPLAIISASAQFCLKNFDLSNSLREHFQAIHRNVKNANNLVTDLLNFAKPTEMNLKYEDINKIIQNTVELLKPESDKRKIRLIKYVQSNPPKIKCDKKFLQQVFMNIVINALQATPKDNTVRVESQLDSTSKMIQVNITDTGSGIPEEYINKIFEPFFSTKEGGTGLGLSICQRIISEHKGNISVESNKGEGTKFTVTLPVTT